MKHFVLKAKHWQLFLAAFIVPFILNLWSSVSMILEMSSNHTPQPVNPFVHMNIGIWLSILRATVAVYWGWSVVVSIQEVLPIDERIRVGFEY